MDQEIPDIRKLRTMANLGQDAVAGRSRVCRTYISMAEAGRLVLKAEQYSRILQAIAQLAEERAAAVRKACASVELDSGLCAIAKN